MQAKKCQAIFYCTYNAPEQKQAIHGNTSFRTNQVIHISLNSYNFQHQARCAINSYVQLILQWQIQINKLIW
jgi:hypothetical protein